MSTTLLLGGRIPSAGGATALAAVNGTVAWTGDDSTGRARFGDAGEVLELRGALVTPAFVDAHVHTTSAGLLTGGLDLTGCATLAHCLDQVGRRARPGAVLWGQGWDETSWPERRPPTRAELDRASGGAPVYLSRVDGHCAAVSSALLDRAIEAIGAPGWAVEGPLTREAHHHARRAARESITPGQRRDAQRAFLAGRLPGASPSCTSARARTSPGSMTSPTCWLPTTASRWSDTGASRSAPPGRPVNCSRPPGRTGWPVTCSAMGRSAPGPPRCARPTPTHPVPAACPTSTPSRSPRMWWPAPKPALRPGST